GMVQTNVTVSFACICAIMRCKPEHISFGLFKLSHLTERVLNLALAKKFKALAEQGVGGEKYNAQKKLASLMKRYNITENDIKEDVRSHVRFRVRKEQVKLFVQVSLSVTGRERYLVRWKKPPYFLVGEVTAIEEL